MSAELTRLLDAVLQGVEGSTVEEVEVESGGYRLRLQFGVPAAVIPAQSEVQGPERPELDPRDNGREETIRSGLGGTFFLAPAPDQPPFVQPGQRVEAGQQLGVIEAMKMLHAVEAEQGGTLVRVLAANGEAVEPGTALFLLALDGARDV